MNVKRLPGEVFVTGFDDRERTEVRKLSRPAITKEERRAGLEAFLRKHGFTVDPAEKIYVWA